MSSDKGLQRVRDILNRIERIQRSLSGISFEEFAADSDKTDAAMANFMIIGEAAGLIPDEVQRRYDAIPWADMRRMRNRLIHGYPDASPRIVWDTAVEDLPPIIGLLQALLEGES